MTQVLVLRTLNSRELRLYLEHRLMVTVSLFQLCEKWNVGLNILHLLQTTSVYCLHLSLSKSRFNFAICVCANKCRYVHIFRFYQLIIHLRVYTCQNWGCIDPLTSSFRGCTKNGLRKISKMRQCWLENTWEGTG